MHKSLLVVAGLAPLLFSGRVHGQEVFKNNSFGGGFNFHFGYQAFDGGAYFGSNPNFQLKERRFSSPEGKPLDPNRIMSKAQYAQPSNSMLTFGFQGYGVFNSIIMGGELSAGLGSATTSLQYDTVFTNGTPSNLTSTNSSRYIGTSFLYNVGYVALRKRAIIAYPMLGIGYGASGIWMKSGSTEQRVYPEVADVVRKDDPNLQNMFVWTGNLLLDFGLGFQYMFGASTEDRAKGFSLGFRLGYQYQLPTDNIKVNFNKKGQDSYVQDVSLPKLGNSGFYAKLILGFGKVGEAR
ncbi:MAG TPA: hypothetical protein PKY12_16305 [Catalimonadaceae bacterium]|nr:hypothetical protein [Catalimonadaceae bacterium]